MLDTNIRHSGLEGLFEHALSTDSVKTYNLIHLPISLGLTLSGSSAKKFSLPHSAVGMLRGRNCLGSQRIG